MADGKKQVSLWLPDYLHRQLKAAASAAGMSFSNYVILRIMSSGPILKQEDSKNDS